jgi:tRNA-modifying protein YgfZ
MSRIIYPKQRDFVLIGCIQYRRGFFDMSDWQNSLIQLGAHMEQADALHFGDLFHEAEQSRRLGACVPLTDVGVLACRGADAATFLQGQLTCNVSEVSATATRLAAYCNPKGRAFATVRLWFITDTFYLTMHKSLVAAVIARLQKYILFSKATLSDVSEEWKVIGLLGGAAFDGLPAETDSSQVNEAACYTRLRGAEPRYLVLAPREQALALLQTGSKTLPLAGINAWHLSEIEAGTVHIGADQCELHIPQTLNYDLIGGISFNKGCYVGQEIIARLHFRGESKQRLYPAYLDTDVLPAINAPLFDITGAHSGTVGQVIDSAWCGKNRAALAVILRTELALSGAVGLERNGLERNNTPPLEVLAPPYAINK